jgi:hypothetical protein
MERGFWKAPDLGVFCNLGEEGIEQEKRSETEL